MLRRAIAGSLLSAIGGVLATGSVALGAVPHTVQPGESLWSIAASNNLTTRTVAVFNGLPENAGLLVGTTVYVPTVAEGGYSLATGSPGVQTRPTTVGSPQAPAATSAPSTAAPGTGAVPSPYGTLTLVPSAADAWNRMRAESMSTYGVDLYPGGALSALRTYAQQSQLYEAFLAGQGAPANPPGTSSHELGTAVDLPTPEMRSVIDQIGWKYGWSKVHAPGEWWHVDYVGP